MKRTRLHHPTARNRAFTLVEIMIVVAIIALVSAIALPGFIRARKRAQATSIRTDLRLIDEATDQYALEYSRGQNSPVTVAAWKLYIKPGSRLYNANVSIFGDPYGDQAVGTLPAVPSKAWDTLIDVCDSSFWAPYIRSP